MKHTTEEKEGEEAEAGETVQSKATCNKGDNNEDREDSFPRTGHFCLGKAHKAPSLFCSHVTLSLDSNPRDWFSWITGHSPGCGRVAAVKVRTFYFTLRRGDDET